MIFFIVQSKSFHGGVIKRVGEAFMAHVRAEISQLPFLFEG